MWTWTTGWFAGFKNLPTSVHNQLSGVSFPRFGTVIGSIPAPSFGPRVSQLLCQGSLPPWPFLLENVQGGFFQGGGGEDFDTLPLIIYCIHLGSPTNLGFRRKHSEFSDILSFKQSRFCYGS